MRNTALTLACLFAMAACAGEDGKDGAAGGDGAVGAEGTDGSEGSEGAEGAVGSLGENGDDRFTPQEGDNLLDLLVDPQAVACDSLELAPPAAGEGVQYQMGGFFSEFFEGEQCKFIRVPEGGIAFNNQNIVYTSGSHHVLLFETPYDGEEPPQFNVRGEYVDTTHGKVFQCPEGAGADWEIDGVIGGSQNPEWDADAMPDDTAFKVEGGTWMMLNTHYLNPSPEGLFACVKLNYETIPVADVVHDAQTLFFYNPVIEVPAQGTTTATVDCTIDHDIVMMGAVQSHMHARGATYKAELYAPNGDLVETLFESDDWETPSPEDYCDGADANCATPYKEIPAGSRIKYTCSYNNGEDRDVYQGLTTFDEMCMFIANVYVKDGDLDEEDATYLRNCGPSTGNVANARIDNSHGIVPGATAAADLFEHYRDGGFGREVQHIIASSCHTDEVWQTLVCLGQESGDCREACQTGPLMNTHTGVCYQGCNGDAANDPAKAACYAQQAELQARCSTASNQQGFGTACVIGGVDPGDAQAMGACVTGLITDCVTDLITECVTEALTPCITECVTDKVVDCTYDCVQNVSCAAQWDAVSALDTCN